jgi:hypothetical protein
MYHVLQLVKYSYNLKKDQVAEKQTARLTPGRPVTRLRADQ